MYAPWKNQNIPKIGRKYNKIQIIHNKIPKRISKIHPKNPKKIPKIPPKKTNNPNDLKKIQNFLGIKNPKKNPINPKNLKKNQKVQRKSILCGL